MDLQTWFCWLAADKLWCLLVPHQGYWLLFRHDHVPACPARSSQRQTSKRTAGVNTIVCTSLCSVGHLEMRFPHSHGKEAAPRGVREYAESGSRIS